MNIEEVKDVVNSIIIMNTLDEEKIKLFLIEESVEYDSLSLILMANSTKQSTGVVLFRVTASSFRDSIEIKLDRSSSSYQSVVSQMNKKYKKTTLGDYIYITLKNEKEFVEFSNDFLKVFREVYKGFYWY